MITPLEIEQKKFTKGVRGYKEDEVDTFLNLIILEMENLIRDNTALTDENIKLKEELANTKSSEEQILETLETAKKLMNDISASAEKRAEVLIKNAELDADLMRREAKEASDRLSEETKDIRSRLSIIKEKYKSLLETELERFDTLSAQLFLDADDLVKSLPEVEPQEEKPPIKDTIVMGDMEDDDFINNLDMSHTMLNIR